MTTNQTMTTQTATEFAYNDCSWTRGKLADVMLANDVSADDLIYHAQLLENAADRFGKAIENAELLTEVLPFIECYVNELESFTDEDGDEMWRVWIPTGMVAPVRTCCEHESDIQLAEDVAWQLHSRFVLLKDNVLRKAYEIKFGTRQTEGSITIRVHSLDEAMDVRKSAKLLGLLSRVELCDGSGWTVVEAGSADYDNGEHQVRLMGKN